MCARYSNCTRRKVLQIGVFEHCEPMKDQDALLAQFTDTFGKFWELAEYADVYPVAADFCNLTSAIYN